MPAQLVAITEGPNILLDKPILLVGRHQECDIQIPSRKVSRRHCCIAQVNDHLMVRDLCSTNGIRINGQKVNEGELHAGDELTIGNFRYQLAWSGQPVPVHPPAHPPQQAKPAQAVPRPALPAALPAAGLPVPLKERDPLESCEEPIALSEAGAPQSVQPQNVQPQNLELEEAPPQDEPLAPVLPTNATAPPRQQSLSIPENLDLAPISDSQAPPQK
jgi:predicted component of type VI protein secretion system